MEFIKKIVYNILGIDKFVKNIILTERDSFFKSSYYFFLYRTIGIFILTFVAIMLAVIGLNDIRFLKAAIIFFIISVIYSFFLFYIINKLKNKEEVPFTYSVFFILDVIYLYLGPTLMIFVDRGTESPIFMTYYISILMSRQIELKKRNILLHYLFFYIFYVPVIIFSLKNGYKIDIPDETLKILSFTLFFGLYYINYYFYISLIESLKFSLDRINRLINLNKIYQQFFPVDLEQTKLDLNHKELIETKHLVVMIGDIRRSTHFLHNAPDHIIFNFLNTFYTIVSRNVSRYNGIIDKFIGDGFLAIYGYTHEDIRTKNRIKVLNAIYTIRDIIRDLDNKIMDEFKKYFPKNLLKLVFVITIGEVSIGIMGKGRRKTFSSVGESIEEAHIIEKFGKTFNDDENVILVTKEVLNIIKEFKIDNVKILDEIEVGVVRNRELTIYRIQV